MKDLNYITSCFETTSPSYSESERSQNKRFFYFVDEVGRGCLAGPVVACAVSLNIQENELADLELMLAYLKLIEVQDSKKISSAKRLQVLARAGIGNIEQTQFSLALKIPLIASSQWNIDFAISQVGPQEIDSLNILQATMLAMRQATETLIKKNKANESGVGSIHHIFIDGNKSPSFDPHLGELTATTVIKGDSHLSLIALASLYAKEFRDHLMDKMDQLYPHYLLAKHKGYGTQAHLEQIKQLGPTAIHRKTFGGVKEYVSSSQQ